MIGSAEHERAQHFGQVGLLSPTALSPTAEEAASAENVIGGAGDDQAQEGGKVCHLSTTAGEAASSENGIGCAGDDQVQQGGKVRLMSPTAE